MRGLGSDHIDTRLRAAQFVSEPGARWLGLPLAELSGLQRVLVVGSQLRKDHPLMAQRIRQAVRHGAAVHALVDRASDWAMPLASRAVRHSGQWVQALAELVAAVAQQAGVSSPVSAQPTELSLSVAQSLLGGERKAILLGNAAAHHASADSLLALAQWLGEHTGAKVGYLCEAANTVGSVVAAARPQAGGMNAAAMARPGALKAAVLLNCEPAHDMAAGRAAQEGLGTAQMVVTLSPFKTNLDISDVLAARGTVHRNSGSFINAEGRIQSLSRGREALGETRPAWKVLRVLANLLSLPGFDFEGTPQVMAAAGLAGLSQVPPERLSNASAGGMAALDFSEPTSEPCVAGIYQLDALVRRAPALQRTADARDAAAQPAAAQHGVTA